MPRHDKLLALWVGIVVLFIIGTFVWLGHVKHIDRSGYHYN